MSTKTFPVQPDASRWYVVDAQGQPLGRMATRVSMVLRGKHKPIYSPHLDHGDHVVIINAKQVTLSGTKAVNKEYIRYTGYIGGQKITTAREMLKKKPEEVIRKAVWGMMPKTRLGRSMFKKLKVYAGPNHPHESQNPEPMPADKAGK